MRLKSAHIMGLKGIYAKSGKHSVAINFDKSIHDIIYIVGPNGSGKSTLMSALSPLPDPPSIFLDGEVGFETLIYENDGVDYVINIQYPINANKTRATTKAYFTTISPDGTTTELNPNGNVSSFKDIVYSKFNLDSNFVSLSYLSGESKGIVEKRPFERKKMVTDLLSSIEVYNEMNKTFNKRSSTFKSLINSITAKIECMGNEEELAATSVYLSNKINTLEVQITELDSMVASANATIKIIDPDGTIQKTHTELLNELDKKTVALKMMNPEYDVTLDDLLEQYRSYQNELTDLNSKVNASSQILNDINDQRQQYTNMLIEKTRKKDALGAVDIEEMEKSIGEYSAKLMEYDKFFKSINLDPTTISKDEFVYGLKSLKDMQDSVLYVRSYADEKNIIEACDILSNKINIASQQKSDQDQVDNLSEELCIIQTQMETYSRYKNIAKILDDMPVDCKIYTCPFIKHGIEAKSKMDDIDIDKLEDRARLIRIDIQSYKASIEKRTEIINIVNDLRSIERIVSNNTILKKLPGGNIYGNLNNFLYRVQSGDTFNDITTLYSHLDKANIVELYKNDSMVFESLKMEYKTQLKANQDIIFELDSAIEDIRNTLVSLDKKKDIKTKECSEYNMAIDSLTEKIEYIDKQINKRRTIDTLINEKREIESKLDTVAGNIDKISAEVVKINSLQSQRNPKMAELNAARQQKTDTEYSLARIAEYKVELSTYERQYHTVELLKKYSSPTKGGIQTIFMQLYMNKTLEIANQILSQMFNGSITLLDYIINENEFRIPCRNNYTNLITDDVSNCSTSEKCMIALALGASMMHQTSPDYDVLRLDEIDGGLDQSNRALFPQILNSVMRMLHISQCIMISHASEVDMSEVDIISLAPVLHESVKGNVIFDLAQ